MLAHKIRSAFSLFAIGLLFSAVALAQITTSSLVGTVSGPDGLIPGATVTIKDNKTNREVSTVTDSSGNFKVPNLQFGAYTVTVTMSGFKTYTANDVVIEVGADYSLPVMLEVGEVSEVVNVTAGADTINAVDSEINANISRKQLDDLPSLGRNPLGFIVLQPGASSNPSQNTVINGVRTSATNTTIDGINVQDNFIRSNATDFSPARPSVDEVEAFAVTSQAGADDGFGGSQVQFTTRRGGNDFNFRMFVLNRNSKFGANSFFANVDNREIGFRNRNQFGGSATGRIIRDKLFFFGSYEKLIDRQPSTLQINTVLTSAASQGLFTYTAAADDAGHGVVAGQIISVNILDPIFGTGITSINPIVQSRFLSQLPAGNSTGAGDLRNTTGYSLIQRADSERTSYVGRIDYLLNSTSTVNGVFRFVKESNLRADIDNSFNIVPVTTQPSVNPFMSLAWNWAPSSNWSNELRGGFAFGEPLFTNAALPAQIVNVPLITNPEVTFDDQGRITDTYNINDALTYVRGDHALRFGAQFQAVRINSFTGFNINPTYNIGINLNTPQISDDQFDDDNLFPGGVPTTQRGTANSLLALLGGIISSGSQAFNVESLDSGFVPGAVTRDLWEYDALGFYFSDQWKVARGVSLNLGMRYDRYTPATLSNGLGLEPVIADLHNILPSLLDPNGRHQFVGGNVGTVGQVYF
ncbi:MAG: TonB-dependent receptor, partial [Pyrinomonadaceae bacterium]